jgi:tRNA modification GTPase
MRPRTDSFLDTIAALATPMGRSALALLRVSGRDAFAVLAAVARGLPHPLTPRRPVLATFVDETGETLDRGLATFFAAPASATGEDVAEISVHGSPIVVERLLAAVVKAGARLARPGEFTERAFLSGRIDLVEAESIRDLIEARTPAAARAGARRLEGGLSARLAAVREDLLAAAAALTAAIDFAEDVGEGVLGQARLRIAAAERALADLSATYETGRLLSGGCRVALLGPPNAGKSTLFNALAGSERAIVTDVPGTTRDTLEATVDVGGIPVTLIDTAGLRETQDRVERIGVSRARQAGESADAVLYVYEASAPWTEEDGAAVAALSASGAFLVVLANKIDLLPVGAGAVTGTPLCGTSPDAGPVLRAILEETLAGQIQTDSSSEILGTLRQKDLVDRAGQASTSALASLDLGEPPEYTAVRVAEALDALADLVGETTSEDVLQRIFSTFCIGK